MTERIPTALFGQLVRFSIVGVLNTLISLSLFKLATDLGAWDVAASAGAFIVGAINSYTLNRIWTFRAGASSAGRFARYVVVQLIGLGTNLVVFSVDTKDLSLPRLAGQAVALVCASGIMFVLNRQWAFAPRPAAAVDERRGPPPRRSTSGAELSKRASEIPFPERARSFLWRHSTLRRLEGMRLKRRPRRAPHSH
jgi:putative flippase GtrA